jgi:hypothetical protein
VIKALQQPLSALQRARSMAMIEVKRALRHEL